MKFAYVTLVMKGNFYVPGALMLAHSLRRTRTKHALVCLITSDVTAIDELHEAFDRVILVEYVIYQSWPRPTMGSQSKYGSWLSESLTQYRCLELIEFGKVCFLDADVVVYRNMDVIFKAPTPAGTFFNTDKKHREQIKPREMLSIAEENDYLCLASSLVLTPHPTVFPKFLKYLDSIKQNGVLGIKGMRAGLNEQMIVFFYSFHLNYTWTNLSSSFQHCSWAKPDPHHLPPYLYHFVGAKKPWEDQKCKKWWKAAAGAITPLNKQLFMGALR